MKEDDSREILTLREVAERLRCSRAHVSKLLNGQVPGLPALTHMAMGRRKVVRGEWLEEWMSATRTSVNIIRMHRWVAHGAEKRKKCVGSDFSKEV